MQKKTPRLYAQPHQQCHQNVISLPKLYHGISNKKGIPVSTLRAFEKRGHKLVKLGLDVKYLENCADLNICPEFFKFKSPKLNVYKDGRDLYRTIVRKKLKEIDKDKRIAQTRFNNQKKHTLSQLSFLEKTCLISLLNKEFRRVFAPHILMHERKLFNLWKKQTDKCPDCVKNFSKKKLNIQEQNALWYGLNYPILPRQCKKTKSKWLLNNWFMN